MTTVRLRTTRNVCAAGVVATGIVLLDHLYAASLRDPTFLNGWILFAGFIFLTSFNFRKKAPVKAPFSASTWLQVHIYVGIVCAILLFLHSGFRTPEGWLESILWAGSLLLILTGFIGLLLSRILPSKITHRSERVIFERLPALRARVSGKARKLVLDSLAAGQAPAIPQFYDAHLRDHFDAPLRFLPAHLWVGSTIQRLEGDIEELKGCHDVKGRESIDELKDLFHIRQDINRQYSIQLLLKAWLFVHVPLAYSVLLISVVHIAVVYAMASGAP